MYQSNRGLMPNRPPQIPGSSLAPKTGIAPRPTIGMEPRMPGGKPREVQRLGYERGNKHTAYSREERLKVLAMRKGLRRRAQAQEAGMDPNKIPGGGISGVEKERVSDPKNPMFDRRTRDAIRRRDNAENARDASQQDVRSSASPLDSMPKPGSKLRSTRSVLREMHSKMVADHEAKRQRTLEANKRTGPAPRLPWS
jgi:hypothetical protein